MWRTYHTAAVCLVINVCLYFYVNSTVFLIVLTVCLFGFFAFHKVSIKYFSEINKPRSQTKFAGRYLHSKTMSTPKARNSDICNDSSFDTGLLNNYESRLGNPKLKRDSLRTRRESIFDNTYQDEILRTSQLRLNDNLWKVDLPSPIRPLRDSPSRVFKPSPLPFSSKRVSTEDVGGDLSSPAGRSAGVGHFPWLGLTETCYSPILIKSPPSAYGSPTDSSHGGTPRQTAKIRLSRLNKSDLGFSEPVETTDNAEESTTKSVIQVLKAISRKRVYMPVDDDEDEIVHQAKRRAPEHNLSMVRLEGEDQFVHLAQQPGSQVPGGEEERGKRCRRPDWDLPLTSQAKKRRKNCSFYNNEIYSSYSSSRFLKKGGMERPSSVETLPPPRLSEPSITTNGTSDRQLESTSGENHTNGQTSSDKNKPEEVDSNSEKAVEEKKVTVQMKKAPPPFAKSTIAKEPMTVTKPMADAILKSTIEKLLLSGEKLCVMPSSPAPAPAPTSTTTSLPTLALGTPTLFASTPATAASTAVTSAPAPTTSALFGSLTSPPAFGASLTTSLTEAKTTATTSTPPMFNFGTTVAKSTDESSPKPTVQPPSESEKPSSGFTLLQETLKEAPKIAPPTGFTFGATEQPNSKTTDPSKTAPSPFAFGVSTTCEQPKLSFGTPSTQPAPGGFKLLEPSQTTTAATTTNAAAPSFSFGSAPSAVPATSSLSSTTVTASQVPPVVTATSTENKTDFKFGTGNLSSGVFKFNENPTDEPKTTKTPQIAQGIFSFGGNKPVESKPEAKKPEEPNPFQFGGGTAKKESISGGFSFSNSTSKPSLFTTAAPLPASTTTSSTFGVSAPTFTFNAGSTLKKENKPGGFSFSTAPTTAAATTTAEQKSVLSFSGATTTQASAAPAFGSAIKSPFGSTPTPTFGSTALGATSTAFKTGTFEASAAPTFGSSAATTAAPAHVFGSSSVVPTFGSATASTPTFGSAQTAASTFGSQTAPTFGSSSAFGQTQSTPSFGSTSTTPAFGSSVPAFGTPAQPASSTPAFGSTTPAPTFGSAAAQPAAPAFGSAPPAFGASTPAFGSAPSFGSAAAAPSFGAAPSGGSTFGAAESKPFTFGASTQPAAAPNSGFSFTAPQTAPQPAAGGLFQFGAGAASPAPSQPFQFNAAQPSPAGFAASFTPGVGGNQQMFSIGSGSTVPRSRPVRRKK